ncbi:MAG: hypothetical protein WCT03_25785 [Candidatus Obscuribacterales bacterium]
MDREAIQNPLTINSSAQWPTIRCTVKSADASIALAEAIFFSVQMACVSAIKLKGEKEGRTIGSPE